MTKSIVPLSRPPVSTTYKTNRWGGEGNSSRRSLEKVFISVMFRVCSSTIAFSHKVRPRTIGKGFIGRSPKKSGPILSNIQLLRDGEGGGVHDELVAQGRIFSKKHDKRLVGFKIGFNADAEQDAV